VPGGRNTTYSSEQWRVWKRNQRANPSRGRCVKCGKQATDHAHTGKSLSSSTRPMCRSCHTRMDNLAGLHR
jgi:hypothetical protein